MAIKLPDPGNGIPEQKTGNDEWTNMKIVRDNFADQSNAASRLVGVAASNLVEASEVAAAFAIHYRSVKREIPNAPNANDLPFGSYYVHEREIITVNKPPVVASYGFYTTYDLGSGYRLQEYQAYLSTDKWVRWRHANGTWGEWHRDYNSGNTTVDSNKNIKQSSPVVRVFSDHLDKIHEANDLPIKYTRNGVGDYTIEGTTGLRENSWQIVIPEDDHRNQLIAFTMEDDNGTIHLKTYKRTFSMETFTFGPDLKTPMDIPEGRWVDLHFNDLPQEQLDEPAI